jgi:phosphatidylglycerophosphatase C
VPTAFGMARHPRRLAAALVHRDRDELKALATEAVFTGRSYASLTTIAESFAEDVHRSWMRDDTLATLRGHQRFGHTIVLVSASYGIYLRPLAALLGVDNVIGTELDVDAEGYCTGRLVDGNCRGAVKVVRLHRWLDGSVGGRAHTELWAYGDSAGDRELIADADHGTWVAR